MKKIDKFNTTPITAITKSLCIAVGAAPPEYAAESVSQLDDLVREKSGGAGADKIVIYNPDAIGEWIAERYSRLIPDISAAELIIPMLSVYPPKTPVCFGSMYTGAKPSEHGIEHYEKRRINIDSFFDALIRAGKRAAIVSVASQSMDILYRGRDMEYFAVKDDGEAIEKGVELIESTTYDVIVIYNQEYDDMLHRTYPESYFCKRALRRYNEGYRKIKSAVIENYAEYNTLLGVLTDHGSHMSPYLLGTHGKNIPKDMNILHFYDFINKQS